MCSTRTSRSRSKGPFEEYEYEYEYEYEREDSNERLHVRTSRQTSTVARLTYTRPLALTPRALHSFPRALSTVTGSVVLAYEGAAVHSSQPSFETGKGKGRRPQAHPGRQPSGCWLSRLQTLCCQTWLLIRQNTSVCSRSSIRSTGLGRVSTSIPSWQLAVAHGLSVHAYGTWFLPEHQHVLASS